MEENNNIFNRIQSVSFMNRLTKRESSLFLLGIVSAPRPRAARTGANMRVTRCEEPILLHLHSHDGISDKTGGNSGNLAKRSASAEWRVNLIFTALILRSADGFKRRVAVMRRNYLSFFSPPIHYAAHFPTRMIRDSARSFSP